MLDSSPYHRLAGSEARSTDGCQLTDPALARARAAPPCSFCTADVAWIEKRPSHSGSLSLLPYRKSRRQLARVPTGGTTASGEDRLEALERQLGIERSTCVLPGHTGRAMVMPKGGRLRYWCDCLGPRRPMSCAMCGEPLLLLGLPERPLATAGRPDARRRLPRDLDRPRADLRQRARGGAAQGPAPGLRWMLLEADAGLVDPRAGRAARGPATRPSSCARPLSWPR